MELYDHIIELLNGLSPDQKERLLLCMKRDQSLVMCLGFEKIRILENLNHIDDIIHGRAFEFCSLLKHDDKFARAFEINISRILTPDDHMTDFMNFRSENWPEE